MSGSLLGVAAVAWLGAFGMGAMMGAPTLPVLWADLALFAGSWTTGMIAMMFPTAVPMMLVFITAARRASPEIRAGGGPTLGRSALFIGSYIAIWAGTGVLVYLVLAAVSGFLGAGVFLVVSTPLGVGLALALVGAYQLSPLKGECLHKCHPTTFLYRFYRGGRLGPIHMGGLYAKYCVGCCWVMMLFLLLVGAMGPLWMVLLGSLIFLERAVVRGPWPSRAIGVGFLASGAFVLVVMRSSLATAAVGASITAIMKGLGI